jgi:protein tyrosine/serine phosphatase
MDRKQSDSSMDSVPFNQAYWVVPGKLMAGCYPGSEDPVEANRKLQGLIEHGIRHIVNLMEPGEINRAGQLFVPYEKRLKEFAAAEGCEVTVERFAIKDMGVPGRVEMRRILDRIDASIEQKRPVYVHCLGGIGRTGTVVGCFLARHGYASDQRLLEHIQTLRKNTIASQIMSPETSQQIELVYSWVEAE